jgi:hypothetical protein
MLTRPEAAGAVEAAALAAGLAAALALPSVEAAAAALAEAAVLGLAAAETAALGLPATETLADDGVTEAVPPHAARSMAAATEPAHVDRRGTLTLPSRAVAGDGELPARAGVRPRRATVREGMLRTLCMCFPLGWPG